MSHHDHDSHHAHHGKSQQHCGRCESTESSNLSDREKLARIISHWIHHNRDHAQSFQQWAQRADSLGEEAAARLLTEAAQEMLRLNAKFELALASLKR